MLDSAATHPKIRLLARELRIAHPWALGIMNILWIFTKDHYPAGDIGRAGEFGIEDAVGWPPERSGELVKALLKVGLLDAGEKALIVHDWSEHCGQYVIAKLARKQQLFADGTIPVPARNATNHVERGQIRAWLRSLGVDWGKPEDEDPGPNTPKGKKHVAQIGKPRDKQPQPREEMDCEKEMDCEVGRSVPEQPRGFQAPTPIRPPAPSQKTKSIRPPTAAESPMLAALAQGGPNPALAEAVRDALLWFRHPSMPELDKGVVLELASAAHGLRESEIRPALREFLESETAWKRNRQWHPNSWGFFIAKWKPWLAKRPRDMPMGDEERAAVEWAQSQEVRV